MIKHALGEDCPHKRSRLERNASAFFDLTRVEDFPWGNLLLLKVL
jgi:hypothetical protein